MPEMNSDEGLCKCFICKREDIPADEMSGKRCKMCERDYTNFRRAFKKEYNRYPTMKEFMEDD